MQKLPMVCKSNLQNPEVEYLCPRPQTWVTKFLQGPHVPSFPKTNRNDWKFPPMVAAATLCLQYAVGSWDIRLLTFAGSFYISWQAFASVMVLVPTSQHLTRDTRYFSLKLRFGQESCCSEVGICNMRVEIIQRAPMMVTYQIAAKHITAMVF